VQIKVGSVSLIIAGLLKVNSITLDVAIELFEKDLTAREAERRIMALKAEIELANSF